MTFGNFTLKLRVRARDYICGQINNEELTNIMQIVVHIGSTQVDFFQYSWFFGCHVLLVLSVVRSGRTAGPIGLRTHGSITVVFRISDMGLWLRTNSWGPILFSPLNSFHPLSPPPYHTHPFPSFRSSPLKSSYRKAWESVVSFPGGVWGRAPAAIKFGTFYALTSAGYNKF